MVNFSQFEWDQRPYTFPAPGRGPAGCPSDLPEHHSPRTARSPGKNSPGWHPYLSDWGSIPSPLRFCGCFPSHISDRHQQIHHRQVSTILLRHRSHCSCRGRAVLQYLRVANFLFQLPRQRLPAFMALNSDRFLGGAGEAEPRSQHRFFVIFPPPHCDNDDDRSVRAEASVLTWSLTQPFLGTGAAAVGAPISAMENTRNNAYAADQGTLSC